jgi:hypothetical protein
VQGARATLAPQTVSKRRLDDPRKEARSAAPRRPRSSLMAKFLLLSMLIMTVAIPMRYAKEKNPKVGLKRTIIAMTVFIWLWVFYLVYIHIKIL